MAAAEAFEVSGEWFGGTDGPDTGRGALYSFYYCAVSAGEDLGMVKGLQGWMSKYSPFGIAKKFAFG